MRVLLAFEYGEYEFRFIKFDGSIPENPRLYISKHGTQWMGYYLIPKEGINWGFNSCNEVDDDFIDISTYTLIYKSGTRRKEILFESKNTSKLFINLVNLIASKYCE